MGQKKRIIGAAALGLLLFGGAFVAMNWTNIQRLRTVNTLFDADKIVHNFSHMNEAFLYQDLEVSAEPFIWPENPTPLPENVTVAGKPRNLTKLLETLDTTALVIIQDGKLLSEAYYRGTERDDRRISWSMAKSFMSGLYGQALENGQIKSLDETVESYAPSLNGSAYEGATIRNVLNMASGITYNEDYMDPKSDINDMGKVLGLGGSMDDYAAGLTKRDVPAGERWKYVSIDTHVAAMVLRAATGKSLHQLFNETYSANLGFENAPFYMTDGENVAFALGGLNLTTRDYAKFGQLFLGGGKFGGKQVIPADWVSASTKHSAPTIGDRGVGYGYQWWVPMPQSGPNAGDFFAVGIYGQYIYINPAKNLVIAKNAADREFANAQDGYGHSMNVNIDMMRSLADHYALKIDSQTQALYDILGCDEACATKLKPLNDLDKEFNDEVRRILWGGREQNLETLEGLKQDMTDVLNEDDFGEVFGLARACNQNCEDKVLDWESIRGEMKANGVLPKDDALPNSEDLNEIWEIMLEEIKKERKSE